MASNIASPAGNATKPDPSLLANLLVGVVLKLPKPADGDINYGWQIEVAATVTFLLAFFAVSLRTAARWKFGKLGWDDHLMIFAIIQALLATISDYIAVKSGLGRHIYYLTVSQASNQQLWQYIAQTFCLNALTCGKISLCLSYLRIMRGGNQYNGMKWALYITAALTLVINSIVIIAQFGQCIPAKKSWSPLDTGTCWQPPAQITLVLIQGATSALTDFFLAGFPFVLFSKLQVSRASKIILLMLMGLGVVTGIFATVRTIQAGLSINSPTAIDLSFNTIPGLIWAGMERNVALMIASIPPTRPLLSPVISKLSSGISSRTSKLSFFSSNKTSKTNSKANNVASYEMNDAEKSSPYVRMGNKAAPNNTLVSSYGGPRSKGSALSPTIISSDNHSQEQILPKHGMSMM